MDKQFEEWIREFDAGYKGSEAYNNLISKGYSETVITLQGWYLQFKQAQAQDRLVNWTKWLVFGTWALVIATVALVLFKA